MTVRDEGKTTWAAYLSSVAPLKHRKTKSIQKSGPRWIDKRKAVIPDDALPALSATQALSKKDLALSKKDERSLRRGTIAIDGRIDLHGLTQKEAYAALCRFMRRHAAMKHRSLLVITGIGVRGDSVLRKNLPLWCSVPPLSEIILSLTQAGAKQGGAGAFFVRLAKTNKT